MATDQILALLLAERDKITGAIEALQGPTKRKGRPPGSGRKAVLPSVEQDSKPVAVPAKRKLSAAGRRAIIAGTKKRWAAVKAANAAAAAPAPVAVAPKAAPAKAAAAKTTAFRKKMSETMKKAWAARKKKAAAKAK